MIALGACGPPLPSTSDDESIPESSTDETPADLLDDDHVLEAENVPTDLEMIASGAVMAFQNSGVPQRCPHPNLAPSGGPAGMTPEISLDCNAGPNRRCVPASGGGGAGFYPSELWTENPMWSAIGFEKTDPHCFHYDFIVTNDLRGEGSCSFTAEAFADLDADYIFSTYRLQGSVDQNGATLEALFVDRPYE